MDSLTVTDAPHDMTDHAVAPDAIAVAAHLHDTTIQHAAAALMLLDAARSLDLPDASVDLLEQVSTEIRLALSTAREAMDRLDPGREHLQRPITSHE